MSSIPTPEHGPNTAGFVFGKAGEEGGPNKVIGALPINTYLVQYTDGAGQKSVRLVFKAPDSETAFILNEKIQGSFVATAGNGWFNKALSAKLQKLGLEGEGADDGAESL